MCNISGQGQTDTGHIVNKYKLSLSAEKAVKKNIHRNLLLECNTRCSNAYLIQVISFHVKKKCFEQVQSCDYVDRKI